MRISPPQASRRVCFDEFIGHPLHSKLHRAVNTHDAARRNQSPMILTSYAFGKPSKFRFPKTPKFPRRIFDSDHTRLIASDLGHIAHLVRRFHGGGSNGISQTNEAGNYSERFSPVGLNICRKSSGAICGSVANLHQDSICGAHLFRRPRCRLLGVQILRVNSLFGRRGSFGCTAARELQPMLIHGQRVRSAGGAYACKRRGRILGRNVARWVVIHQAARPRLALRPPERKRPHQISGLSWRLKDRRGRREPPRSPTF